MIRCRMHGTWVVNIDIHLLDGWWLAAEFFNNLCINFDRLYNFGEAIYATSLPQSTLSKLGNDQTSISALHRVLCVSWKNTLRKGLCSMHIAKSTLRNVLRSQYFRQSALCNTFYTKPYAQTPLRKGLWGKTLAPMTLRNQLWPSI